VGGRTSLSRAALFAGLVTGVELAEEVLEGDGGRAPLVAVEAEKSAVLVSDAD
jgi:hypothetical protein